MNKNWNDRADKDLFFTILQVKQIGVISGSEWTTIGNSMRGMGYGFTNEGCRQHFQGLRRAQAKSDSGSGSNGAPSSIPNSSTSARSHDPTMNPITRRPGPGRGRPKKSTAGQEGADSPGTPGTSPVAAAPGVTPVPSGIPLAPGMSAVQMHPNYSKGPVGPGPDVGGLQIGHKGIQPPPVADQPMLPPTGHNPIVDDELALDPSLEDPDEQVAKRPRLDDSQDPSLDPDEAVLSAALAAHNSRTVDNYDADFSYGDT